VLFEILQKIEKLVMLPDSLSEDSITLITKLVKDTIKIIPKLYINFPDENSHKCSQ
jgi:hypothetical protein